MCLVNCKIQLKLRWTKNSVMSNVAGDTEFKKKHEAIRPHIYCGNRRQCKANQAI